MQRARRGTAQLFAVQAEIDFDSYRSADAFEEMVLRQARRVDTLRARDADGAARYPALAVWPENLGSFLALTGRADLVADATSTQAAMRRVAARELPRMTFNALRYGARSLSEALYVTVAPEVHRILWQTFSRIASNFDLWIVAGSALLPANARGIDTSEFEPTDARTYNTSYTFAPTGHCVAVNRKVNLVPTQEDELDLTAASAGDLDIVDTPVGRLGTLICYDGFHEAHTSHEPDFTPVGLVLDGLGVDVVAQPSANAWPWDAPWAFNAPDEHMLRSEQWFCEGLYRHMQDLETVRYAVNPQLVGSVFENHFEAPSLILERTERGHVEVLARASDPTVEDVVSVTVPVDTAAPVEKGTDPSAT